MNGKKLERPLYLDMAFGEAMARYAQTRPGEVEPPAGRKRKVDPEPEIDPPEEEGVSATDPAADGRA
jgi:hypothetical protein